MAKQTRFKQRTYVNHTVNGVTQRVLYMWPHQEQTGFAWVQDDSFTLQVVEFKTLTKL